MERIPMTYTPGEVRALVAPILGLSAEQVEHVYLVASTPMDGDQSKVLGYGCDHGKELLEIALELESE